MILYSFNTVTKLFPTCVNCITKMKKNGQIYYNNCRKNGF